MTDAPEPKIENLELNRKTGDLPREVEELTAEEVEPVQGGIQSLGAEAEIVQKVGGGTIAD